LGQTAHSFVAPLIDGVEKLTDSMSTDEKAAVDRLLQELLVSYDRASTRAPEGLTKHTTAPRR